ncbi:MAG: N-6 DNA methylase [Gammaproteobacteria bacterium]|nr:N-6 DNA methylase [Gammaproteobacteria bacterium]MYF58267.1 N-6 DNA methylase [Gammaproteobacteria bacterium]
MTTQIESFSHGATRAILTDGSAALRDFSSPDSPEQHLAIARSFVYRVVSEYWKRMSMVKVSPWPLRKLPAVITLAPLTDNAQFLARKLGTTAARLDVARAGYRIGVLYTGSMPEETRAKMGAHYTPPALCERLLDMATGAGVDWLRAKVLDPACGGGAFLSPLARRMATALEGCGAETVLRSIERRLSGNELDPFAAWLSEVFLDAAIADVCRAAGRRLNSVVRVCDTLEQFPGMNRYDLVVGNPPYRRVTLPAKQRERFGRSLFGHANLYGLFTDMALRYARSDGVIAYVTPTSFLSGEYFKALRGLLASQAPPVGIDFIAERKGVFDDVLQETLLATYRRGREPAAARVHCVAQDPSGSIRIVRAGSFELPERPEEPWLIPRSARQRDLLGRVSRLRYRLADYGYTVSTGPLVWNRHKESLRDEPAEGRYPLIWAESVRSGGVFEFRAEKRNHKPYFEPTAREQWVVTSNPCVLLQRTTAKEQSRRLIAAELPGSFIEAHGAVVVENHLNMIKPLNKTPPVSPAILTALLNSTTVDQVFRCINGSVAVSAYELQALPLPCPNEINRLERLTAQGARRDEFDRAVERLYRGTGG